MKLWEACREAAADLALCWRRSGTSWFDFFELAVIYLFARLWHRCARSAPGAFPATGPVLLIANHASHADPAFLVAMTHRPLRFLQARECYEVPLLRRLYARVGCIPVARGRPDPGALREALRRLKAGEAVAVFPEGDVEPQWHGCLQPGKPGAALLALRSRAPVVPAWIEGGPRARTMLRAWLCPSGGVRVTFGPPTDLSAYQDRVATRPVLDEVTALLMRQLAALRPTRGTATGDFRFQIADFRLNADPNLKSAI